MRDDVRILGVVMRDETVPATLTIIDGDTVVNSPVELDENAKDRLVKRFAERLLQQGLQLHDWKEKD